MIDVDFDIDEDIKARDGGGINRHEAAVTIVNQKIGAEGDGGEVIDATRAIGDVTEDETFRDIGEGGEDVGENKRVHEETLRELEGDAVGASGEDAPERFVDLEVVVGRENGDSGIERRVVKD